jgi:SAM-dependent methyltransferase
MSFVDVDAEPLEQQAAAIGALDLQSQLPAISRLKAWVVEQLDPQPGMHVLDVGCGTGEDVRGLAAGVGLEGTATGVDPSRVMLAEAERRAAATGSPARFLAGRADSLPLDDAVVDLVRCERVLQHLTDPAAGVGEMFRVLRPGGRVGLVDTDWRTLAIWPADTTVALATRDAWLEANPNPAAGAQLVDLVLGAGFTNPQMVAETLLLRPRSIDAPPMTLFLAAARASASLAPALIDAWLPQLEEAAGRRSLVISVTMHAVCATHP